MLMFGLGGIFVEVLKDVAFHLAPITEAEAVQMLKSTRSYMMLEGRRDSQGLDISDIAAGLQRISQLTTDLSPDRRSGNHALYSRRSRHRADGGRCAFDPGKTVTNIHGKHKKIIDD
jgi:hypothetical protein